VHRGMEVFRRGKAGATGSSSLALLVLESAIAVVAFEDFLGEASCASVQVSWGSGAPCAVSARSCVSPHFGYRQPTCVTGNPPLGGKRMSTERGRRGSDSRTTGCCARQAGLICRSSGLAHFVLT
jgi:hypothetical protein